MTKSLRIGLLHLAPELGALDANGALVCADAYAAEPALRLRAAGAQLLVSSAACGPASGARTASGRRERSTQGYR